MVSGLAMYIKNVNSCAIVRFWEFPFDYTRFINSALK